MRTNAIAVSCFFGTLAATTIGLGVNGCSNRADDCSLSPLACPPASPAASGGAGGTAATNTGGTGGATGGAGGTGGAPPECTTDTECTDPARAKCDAGTCVACDASPQCESLAATPVCATTGARAGTCVACTLTEAGSCTAMQTCNLLDETCADVEPSILRACQPCTNDDQCETNHRCVPMDFPIGTDLGFYCLEDATLGTCERPYGVLINETSLNGEPATNYCGIDQDAVSCPAVIALQQSWQCSGTPGMCSPDGIVPEEPVPGALCEQVGAFSNRCTYACAVVDECPAAGPPSTCGNGGMVPPGWCGG
ncbi:MAG: hypothetical protein AAF715_31725 [Myxococcota bacterium]